MRSYFLWFLLCRMLDLNQRYSHVNPTSIGLKELITFLLVSMQGLYITFVF